ncbi:MULTISPECIES: ATP-binding cassette domain-containing protein [Bifidobacterium]|uniref:ATP-binding cassette domain-containing protein n=1 Tax=Bifidobacterium TaxID=1678 RepID=UPI001BDC25E8|nr:MULTISPECIES: ATP-binding cassette domain-containing protein [Bifidobacterium]MBT1161058.1 ATP-binding cassette domain-containing protein [Bifidobacterium sp. SO1]MBW3078134.1 ATP-binding cassette domain-containing protein [Bifidobacterium simiiventris]
MDAIRIRSLAKRYAGKRAVDHFDMSVPQGAIYGFVGKNGAGKSTVMKMIAGLITPSGGEITLFGNTSDGAGNAGGGVQRVGALIENPGLLPHMSAFDTMMAQALALGVADPKPVCRDLLDQVGLGTVGRKTTGGFSLGMKQRLGLALALVGGPDLLLLDEPLNGLDPDGARTMRNYLVQLNQQRGITIVISSHVLDQLERMCTHYGVIANGHMVREMTAEQVQAECGDSLTVRTADTATALAMLEDRLPDNPTDPVRFAAEPDGSITIAGGFDAAEVSRILHETNQTILELSAKSHDMEDFFVALMDDAHTEGSR